MAGVNEDKEEFPGNYILYNKDDDDSDGIPDYDDDENIYENDLVAITLSRVEPYEYMTGQVTFDVTSGASKVIIWENSTKGTQVSLPATFNTPGDLGKTFYVEGIEPSDGPRDVTIKLTYTKGGRIFEDKIKVTVFYVEFVEDTGQIYGYDDYSDIDPWKSVRDSSNTDTAKANIETSGVAGEIYFKSSDTNKVTVSPENASGSPQTVTFTGVSRTTPSPTVWAKGGSIDGCTLDLIDVAVYKQVAGTETQVKLIYVIEDNDDVQEIEPGESGSSTTDICVSPGANGKRDTLKGNDDVYSGENILVLCQTSIDG
jgi:hypothetical protein